MSETLSALLLSLSALVSSISGGIQALNATPPKTQVAQVVASSAPLLPQSVYDQWADPSVSVINMPAGTYYLKTPLVMKRSNVTVNFAGTTLLADPEDGPAGFYPIKVQSTSDVSVKYPLLSPVGNPASRTRSMSHLTGVITESTTQLTMDPNEIINVTPGETVMIWAGVTPSDPVEPSDFIPATVASVNMTTGVITFTAPLGKNVTNYGSLSALSAVTAQGQGGKVGNWGVDYAGANFSKGFGTDHGMERFVGGMIHDVTFNNLTLILNPVTSGGNNVSTGSWDVSAIGVKNFTINNLSITNPFGSGVHLWKTFNTTVNGATFTGAGLSEIWNGPLAEATAFTIWGGNGFVYKNVSIKGTNMSVFNTEVQAGNITLDGLDYDVTFTSARTYGESTLFGFYSVRDTPRLINVSIKAITTSGPSHHYFSYAPFISDGYLRFVGSALTDYFDFGYQKFPKLNGTLTLGGIQYGPTITETKTVTITHGTNSQKVTLPKGIYTAVKFRLKNVGDLRGVSDGWGYNYFSTATQAGEWTKLSAVWHQIPPGDAKLVTYVDKYLWFWQNNKGSVADAVVEFEYTYLPVTGGTAVPPSAPAEAIPITPPSVPVNPPSSPIQVPYTPPAYISPTQSTAVSTVSSGPITLTLLGNNPAYIERGNRYNDPGVQVVGSTDYLFKIKATVNGKDMGTVDAIQLDTQTVGTSTISYLVTDSQGKSASATRDVVIYTSTSFTPPAQTPIVSSAPGIILPRTISIGSQGSDVTALQQFLIAKGYLPSNTSPLGYFGPATREAVKKYQCATLSICFGDESTTGYGMAGQKTRALINTSGSIGSSSMTTLTPINQSSEDARIKGLMEQIASLLKLIEKLRAQIAAMKR